MKTENFYGQAQYQAPGMKMVKLSPRGHFLQGSPDFGGDYGDSGHAGGDGRYDDTDNPDL